ncbi:MAG: hypothetical protein H0W08_00370 [Acidobacteria bacterium]|nr:hypothetical protein [Acidobacteriota bacterium]
MRQLHRLGRVVGITLLSAGPVFAQSEPPPPLLEIVREEVRPGKAGAHAVVEAGWGAAYSRLQAPITWLGMRSLAGPSEAWFLTPWASYAAWEKADQAMEANAALSTEQEKFSSQDGDLLSRTSNIMATFRPGLSYQPQVNLAKMRYMAVDIVRTKPGRGREFTEAWQMQVAAHNTAKMDEHWAVYGVVAGMADGVFLFFYPATSLAALDASGPMHTGDPFRNAVGENGRSTMREMMLDAVEGSQRMLFKLSPQMSTLPKGWSEADPFWTPKAPTAAPKKPGDKR